MSREMSIPTVTATVFALLLASSPAGAQSSTNFTLAPGVASAGGRASSTNFKLSTDVGRSAEFDALCVGGTDVNSFYGDGIVNAAAVVRKLD